MRLGLSLIFSLMLLAIGCGGSSNYMLPVDSPVYPYEKPEAEEFQAEAPMPAATDATPTYDPDLLDEEVGDDDDDMGGTDSGEPTAGAPTN